MLSFTGLWGLPLNAISVVMSYLLVFYMFFKVEGGSDTVNDMASTMMQKFWDSALALEPPDDECDIHR